MTEVHGHINLGGNVYDYGGFIFEVHHYCGPHPLNKKTQEPYKNVPGEKHRFWKVWDSFFDLSDKEKEKFLLQQGGCIFF